MTRRRFLQAAALTGVAALTARADTPRRLLVLGGTGFLGRHVTELALQRNYQVTLFHRTESKSDLYPQARSLIGDRDQGFPEIDANDFDYVIDTSGQKPRWLEDSTRALHGCKRYLFVSTISVYRNSAHPLNEDSPVVTTDGIDLDSLGPGTYPARKIASEARVLQNCGPRGLIVRPCVIAGPYDATDRFTYWAERLARGGEVLAPHAASESVQWIDARDLAAWMLQALEADLEGIFNLAGPSPASGFGHFLQSLRPDAKLVWVSKEFLEEHKVQPWADLPLWVPSGSENAGFTQVSAARALSHGLHLRPARATARDTLAWRHTDPQPLRAGLSPDRESEILRLWKAK